MAAAKNPKAKGLMQLLECSFFGVLPDDALKVEPPCRYELLFKLVEKSYEDRRLIGLGDETRKCQVHLSLRLSEGLNRLTD